MNSDPKVIFGEYTDGINFKSSLGTKGLYEQSRINERFYTGDQWHGVDCGDKRPLVRHNVIKRIGDYKMSQILSNDVTVKFSAEGIPDMPKKPQQNQRFTSEKPGDDEINTVMSALSNYRSVTARRLDFDNLCAKALKNSFITGSGVIYTYWDPDVNTGLYAGGDTSAAVKGDIKSEVLDIEDIYFADPYETDVQQQKYIIIASLKDAESVRREAESAGADEYTISMIKGDDSGKVILLTKLFKQRNIDGSITVKCVKVTERATVRPVFDTKLRMYPLAIFSWDERNNCIFGDTELTYLIPNQIAINRMITASVWSSVTMGMPMMVVNGDTVNDNITNDPGQIIRVYGTNEDVAGAVKYVTPPDSCSNFGSAVNTLISNTLIQSGANEVALGDSRADNASALQAMHDAAVLPLRIMKRRFYGFIEQITRIWSDFWITQYGMRKIKIETENGSFFITFDSARYRNLYLTVKVDAADSVNYSAGDCISLLDKMLEKGIINKKQYVARLPKGLIPDTESIIREIKEDDAS